MAHGCSPVAVRLRLSGVPLSGSGGTLLSFSRPESAPAIRAPTGLAPGLPFRSS